MANINGIIQRDKPVDVAGDIYKVLGLAPRLIAGTNLVCYPISYAAGNAHGKINKWSKIKPVEIENGINTRISKDTLAYTAGGSNTLPDGLLTGYTGNIPAYMGRVFSEQRSVGGVTFNLFHVFGMTVPYEGQRVNPLDDFIAPLMRTLILNANAQDVNWKYQNVSGGTKAPFRVLDFEGYCDNAVCPISYQVKDVYENTRGEFSCFRNPEDYDTQIDLAELDKIFKDFKIYVSYFKKGDRTFLGMLEIGDLKDNRDTTVTVAASTLGNPTNLSGQEMEAFFFAGSKSKGIFITLPSLPDYPNPMPFRRHYGNSPNTPIKQLTWKEFGFSLDRTDPFFESFDNVNEGLYTVLFSPEGWACIRARVQNNTDSAQNIELAKLTVTSTNTNRNLGRVIYKQPISGGTMTIQNGTYLTLAKGEECYLYFQINGNLFDNEGVTKAPNAPEALKDRTKYCLSTYIEIRYSSIVELSNELEAYYSPLNDGKHFYAQPPIDKWYTRRSGNTFS